MCNRMGQARAYPTVQIGSRAQRRRIFELLTDVMAYMTYGHLKHSAKEAYDLRIVNKVVPHVDLDAAVKMYTHYFAAAPTRAIGLIKRMLQKSASASLDEMLEYEAYCQEIAGNSLDYQEGVKAFLEKRKPAFTGK